MRYLPAEAVPRRGLGLRCDGDRPRRGRYQGYSSLKGPAEDSGATPGKQVMDQDRGRVLPMPAPPQSRLFAQTAAAIGLEPIRVEISTTEIGAATAPSMAAAAAGYTPPAQ